MKLRKRKLRIKSKKINEKKKGNNFMIHYFCTKCRIFFFFQMVKGLKEETVKLKHLSLCGSFYVRGRHQQSVIAFILS